VSQCGQNVGVRWEFGFLNDCMNQKHFAQWDLKVKTIHLRLLPVRLPPWAYKREVTPLQRVTTETATTTYEITSWIPELYANRSLPHSNLRCYEATLRIPGTIFLPMRVLSDPFPWERVHLRDMIKLFSAFQQLWRQLRKEFLRTIWYLWQVARLAPVSRKDSTMLVIRRPSVP
jgi:hypothetical protein